MKVLVDPAKDLATRPAARPITVRHLLTHTAGLGYNIVTKGPLLGEYNRLGINPAAVNVSLEAQARAARPASLEEFANRVATLPLIADPGSKWSYSISLDVLGRVIEVASGTDFGTFVKTRIFDPLGMRSSYWTVPADQAPRLATNYTMLGTTRVAIDPGATSVWLQPPSFPYGGAGLVMSARDYDRFLHMLLNGGALDGARILKPETVRLAMSNLLPPGVDQSILDDQVKDTGVPMGFGAGGSVTLGDQPGGPGRGTFGWAGAAGTIGWVDPAHRLRATVMINLFGDIGLKRDVRQAIYADLHP
jgi:CubicO group peptidase (beta-lactamase class C family)